MPTRKPGSLKAILPSIAPVLGLTLDALYERQRALVRKGLLQTPNGRGRGSGQKPTLDAVALLVAAVLMSDNLSDIARADDAAIKELGQEVAAAMVRGETVDVRRRPPEAGLVVVATLRASAAKQLFAMVYP